jgi:hypothetical protein
MQTVTFENDSKLQRLPPRTFEKCAALKSICIPASVEIVGERTFSCCTSLEIVSFAPGSKINQIERGVFEKCISLKAIRIPASSVSISEVDLSCCSSLSMLAFDSPSQLQQFSFYPPPSLASVEIPDSVEFLRCIVKSESSRGRVLNFGRESQLRRLDISSGRYWRWGNPFSRTDRKRKWPVPKMGPGRTLFVRMPESVLRAVRLKIE